MGIIYINDLVVEAKHGVHDYEKQTPQRFSVSVELEVDISKASQSDDLADTLDWSMVRDTIVDTVQNNTCNLMERLAQLVADKLLEDATIRQVMVKLEKLDAFPSGTPGIRLVVSRT